MMFVFHIVIYEIKRDQELNLDFELMRLVSYRYSISLLKMVSGQGLEPRFCESNSHVLPLDDPEIKMVRVEGFEPPTPCSQSTYSSQTELNPDKL